MPCWAHTMRALSLAALLCVLATPALSSDVALAADPVVAAVGDLGCAPTEAAYNNGAGTATDCRQRYISDLAVAANPNALLLMGDTQYQRGELANFNAVFDPTFGRLNSVVYPVPGNVEYDDGASNASGYYTYFSNAGVQSRIAASPNGANVGKGYYSFDLGNWHIVGLNSNCSLSGVGGCGPGSPQANWLKADLAANSAGKCVLAYAHHARWNSGDVTDDTNLSTFWNELYGVRADVFLSGHANHHYERHAPQNPSGNPDSAGMRQFIVSTGGEHHGTPPSSPDKLNTLQVVNYTRFGILKLTLHPTSYDWEFVQDAGTTPPPAGAPFTDSGTTNCNSASVTAPAAPSLSATAGNGSAALSWAAPSNGGAAITNYKIYRGTSAGTTTLLTTVGNVTSYTDSTAVNGTTYYYRVAAVNSIGEGAKSNEVSVTPTSTPAVFPRTGVLDSFARAAGGLGASWQSPALADGGTVTIASSGLTKSSTTGSATWNSPFGADQETYLTVPTLPSSGGYVQVYGRVSTQSASNLSMYFLRVTPSGSTWDLRKKVNGADSTSIRTFSAPFGAGDSLGLQISGSTLTAYRKAGSAAWSLVGSVNDTTLTAGGYISFNLSNSTARGGAFGGGTIPTGPVAPTVPAAPTPAASPGNGSVALSWTAPADGGSAITGYKVYRGTTAGATTLHQTLGNVTAYTDATAANGTTYYYRVAAVNSVGDGAQSNEISATPRTVPAAPTLSATAGNNSVGLSWNAPANGGTAITGYRVYRGTTAGATTLHQTLGNVTAYTDATAANGTTYYYRVAAVNNAGEGAQSNEASATPSVIATVPAAPTLAATPGNNSVALSWNAPANGGAAITAYKLYRGTTAGATTLHQTLGNVTAYTDATAVNGTTYYYRVAAVNSVGDGAQSNEISAQPAAPIPPDATFPTTGVLDTFSRAAGELGSNWQSPSIAATGTVTIASSGLTRSGAGSSSAKWTLGYAADQEVFMTVPTLPSGGSYIQVYGRVNTASSSFYFLRVTPSSSTWDLRKKINGADSTSIATFSAPFTAGHSIGLKLQGPTLTAYRKAGSAAPWTSVGSATDAAITAGGFIAFNLADTTSRGGAFGGGSIPAG